MKKSVCSQNENGKEDFVHNPLIADVSKERKLAAPGFSSNVPEIAPVEEPPFSPDDYPNTLMSLDGPQVLSNDVPNTPEGIVTEEEPLLSSSESSSNIPETTSVISSNVPSSSNSYPDGKASAEALCPVDENGMQISRQRGRTHLNSHDDLSSSSSSSSSSSYSTKYSNRSDDWRYLLPDGWSCPANNAALIHCIDDDCLELAREGIKTDAVVPTTSTTRAITSEQIDDARKYVSELRTKCATENVDPRYIAHLVDLCESKRNSVRTSLEDETKNDVVDRDLIVLIDSLNDVINLAKTYQEHNQPNNDLSTQSTSPTCFETSSDPVHQYQHQEQTHLPQQRAQKTAISTSSPTCPLAPTYGSEVQTCVNKKDVFSLICMLRGHNDKRLQAAWALMRFAKQEAATSTEGAEGNNTPLRDEIKSSGGMHSLLTVFKSSGKDKDLKLVTALAVAYLLPSCVLSAAVGLKVIECLYFLIKSDFRCDEGDITRQEIRKTSALALMHFWFDALRPKLVTMANDVNTTAIVGATNKTCKRTASVQLGKELCSCHDHRHGNRGRRLKQRQDMLEIQELLETTVSLIVAIAKSEIEDVSNTQSCSNHTKQHHQHLSESSLAKSELVDSSQEFHQGFNYTAFTVESMCAVECARPVAVREGLLKVLVRWLRSSNVDLVRPAANALRDLTSPHDEYMTGWIHSQIVNEGALPAIIELSESSQSDVRLAVAEILSSLSVAPHTRAAIVEANGLSYVVQLLSNSVDPRSQWDEPLALAAGNALLQLAVGAMVHGSAWGKVIKSIVEGCAIEPLVAMAQSEERGKLRLMSVEALQVISEDVQPGRFTRERLCDAGAGKAFGKVLKHDLSSLYGLIKPAQSAAPHFSKSSEIARGDEELSDEDALQELYYALHALANILEPTTEEEMLTKSPAAEYGYSERDSHNSLVDVCTETAKNGGVESLIWLTSLPIARSNELLVDSCRSLASLCPLLLSDKAASEGCTKWAVDVLLALTGVLKRKVNPHDDDENELVRELQLDALRGLCSLAEYEPLKIRIIDESLQQLFQLKNERDDMTELSQSANQVCIALGFTEDEIDIQLAGNDPKPMADWFSFERSMLLQAMTRDEIRSALARTWNGALREVAHLLPTEAAHLLSSYPECRAEHSNLSDEARSNDDDSLLRRFFKNLGNDSNSTGLREKVIQQYANIYEDVPTKLSRPVSESYCLNSQKCSPTPTISVTYTDERYETNTTHEGMKGKSPVPAGVKVAFPGKVKVIGKHATPTTALEIANDPDNIGFLAQYPYPINGTLTEKDWILSHRREQYLGLKGDTQSSPNSSVVLPNRVEYLLDFYFPSTLFRSEILPLYDLQPGASFNFRALAMPERRYFSFRREGQVLRRLCKKHAGAIDSEDVHWTLGFTNSTFAGEFVETLVQALYRCPIIQALSFSRNDTQKKQNMKLSDEEEDDGSTLLANLAGSLPPWVTHLTFDSIFSKRALDSLVAILKTMGKLSAGCGGNHGVDHDRNLFSALSANRGYSQASPAGHTKGTFHGLAIRNCPHLGGESFKPFFSLLGFGPGRNSLQNKPLISLKVLDLSGNRLGDEIVATVLQIVHTEESRCSLERLDVSNNAIGAGDHVVKVLKNYISKHRQPQMFGIMLSHGSFWCSPLHTLNLSSNNLGVGNAALEIVAMLKNSALSLKSLDLSENGLTGEDGFLDVFCSVNHSTRLVELNLSNNMFSTFSVDGLIRMIFTESDSTPQRLAFLNLNDNNPPLTKDQEERLSHFVGKGRSEQLKAYLQENEKLAAVDSNTAAKKSKERVASSAVPTIDEEESKSETSSNDVSASEKKVTFKTALPPKKGKNMITVLFSAPLVYKNEESGDFQPIEMLDFELERDLLWRCFKEASMDIDLSFDNATTQRLQAAMTKCCGCLHFSGHGHPDCLTFEDDRGGLHWLRVDDLKRLISNGGEGGGAPFKFVFVSACYSGLAGQTFVGAGVEHVVCCQQESQLMDSAALAFTSAFYLALAVGRTVKDSFEIGKQAVNVSPSVPNSEEEMKKFVLLPLDGNHDVPVFDADPVSEWPCKSGATGSSRRDLHQSIPTPPQGFLGREVDMYRVLGEILKWRFVSLVGPTGIGRGSLASALCHYINDRKNTITKIENIYYVRARQKIGNDGMASVITPLYKQLVAAGKIQGNLPRGANMDDVFQSISRALSGAKALVVFDRVEVLDGTKEAQEFPFFLSTLICETSDVHVLMTACKPLGLSSLGQVGEFSFRLRKLSFKSGIQLFLFHCRHVPTAEEERQLLELLVKEDTQARLCCADEGLNERSREIIKFIGDGVPSRIFNAAYQTSKSEFEDFIQRFSN